MLEKLVYKNHMNETVVFGEDSIYINAGDLHDYSWNVTQKNNRVSAFRRSVETRNLPVIIMCDSEEEGTAIRNNLFEVVEKDILAKEPGRIYCGEYYMKGFVTASSKSEYLYSKRYMVVDLTITTDSPYWTKETTTHFNIQEAVEGSGLDYSYDFPYDLPNTSTMMQFTNAGFAASNFKLIIYGACSNPALVIGDHRYEVDCDIGTGEYLTIDSVNKTIYITGAKGEVTNQFNARNRESYIFEKIPIGTATVAWNGTFGFDVILMEERSEPKWT